MQLATQTKTFRSKNIVNKKSYEVASTPHMMKVLSDFIYSDKIGAVLRELGTNAFESHMRANLHMLTPTALLLSLIRMELSISSKTQKMKMIVLRVYF